MKIVAKPKVKVKIKDKKIICPFCGEDNLDIDYIRKGLLNRGIVTGLCFMNTNTQIYKCNTCGGQWTEYIDLEPMPNFLEEWESNTPLFPENYLRPIDI